MPRATSINTADVAAYNLAQALLKPHLSTLAPLCPESIHDTLLRLADIFEDSILQEKQSSTIFMLLRI